jgi:TetR/AcrR family transcriptional repressor of nem operon
MRYSEDHKEKTHAKIVEQASKEFREHGFEGVGIAQLMSKLGLSHGGFYAHFEDKEDLKDQAIQHGLDESYEMAIEALNSGGFRAYIEKYTSDLHRDHPEYGCVLPALCSEEGRRTVESKAKFAERFSENIDLFAERLPGNDLALNRTRVQFIMSALSGSIALSRATGDTELSAEILRSTRQHLFAFLDGL